MVGLTERFAAGALHVQVAVIELPGPVNVATLSGDWPQYDNGMVIVIGSVCPGAMVPPSGLTVTPLIGLSDQGRLRV